MMCSGECCSQMQSLPTAAGPSGGSPAVVRPTDMCHQHSSVVALKTMGGRPQPPLRGSV